jgi:monoamine oxidase
MPNILKLSITRLPYVQNLQVHFHTKTPFWEKDQLPADMLTDGPLGHIIANRDAAGEPTGLFHSSLSGDQIGALYKDGAKGLQQRFRAELARLRPSTYANINILEVVNWTKDNQAAGGAYAQSETSEIIGDPVGRLHFAGSHLGTDATGMEGALESAERAAVAVLA